MYGPLGIQKVECAISTLDFLAHDWAVEHLADLFHTTHRLKTQQVPRSRIQRCGDIELSAYLANDVGPVPLVLDLSNAHERWGSSSNPNGQLQLHDPADIDRPLNEAAADKMRLPLTKYCNTVLTVIIVPVRLHCELVHLLFLQAHRKLTAFLQLQEFSLRKQTTSITVARCSPQSSSQKLDTSSTRLQHCVLT